MAAPTLQLHVLDASDPRSLAARARPDLDVASNALLCSADMRAPLNYGAEVVSRHRRSEGFRKASPGRTLRFAQALVNDILSRSDKGGPTCAATALAAVLAGTVDRQMRFDLGLVDSGGSRNQDDDEATPTTMRTSQEVASILDAVGQPGSTDPADVGFRARVTDEMRAWREALAERVHRRASGKSAELPAASVAAAGLAVACAWAASMRGHPETAGMAVAYWREHGEANARLVEAGAFGALVEPTDQLRAAWAVHGLAEGCARASFREVSRGVAQTLAPAFAKGVSLCGKCVVLHAAARAAALVVAASEYLATRTEPMLVMFAVPRATPKRKRAVDSHATLPAVDGFVSAVLKMCSDLANHPTRAEVSACAKDALLALEPCVERYLPHASAQREGVPFERRALANLCSIVLSNPRPPRQDQRLAKWYTFACQTISRFRLVRPPTAEDEQRVDSHWLLDERRNARIVVTEAAHRPLVEQPAALSEWAAVLGERWTTQFLRYANAKDAADRFAVGVDEEDEKVAALRSDIYTAALTDANSIVQGNDSATRMWAVANVSCAAMRYLTCGEASYSLAAPPLDARVVVCRNDGELGGAVQEKRMATWVTTYPASFA